MLLGPCQSGCVGTRPLACASTRKLTITHMCAQIQFAITIQIPNGPQCVCVCVRVVRLYFRSSTITSALDHFIFMVKSPNNIFCFHLPSGFSFVILMSVCVCVSVIKFRLILFQLTIHPAAPATGTAIIRVCCCRFFLLRLQCNGTNFFVCIIASTE